MCNLITHKRTAKYCLQSRGEEIYHYECDLCQNVFSSRPNLLKHKKSCKIGVLTKSVKDLELLLQDCEEKLAFREIDVEEMRKEIDRLRIENAKLGVYKEEYKVIRDKPTTSVSTTVNNNTTNNKLKLVNTATIDPFTVDLVKNRLEGNEYTYGMFLLGENGIKRFILSMITKDDEKNYVSTDITRPNFHRFKETRKWGLDAGAKFLSNVFNEMKPLVKQYWNKFIEEANNAKSPEEHESFDIDMDKIKPIVLAIDGSLESKARNELLGSVVRYIKPHVAV